MKKGNDSPTEVSSLFLSLFFSLCSPLHTVLAFVLLLLLGSPLLLVDVLAADDLVNDPVENVKNEEDEREGHAGHRVDAFGPTDEELLHLLDAFLGCGRGRGIVVVAFDGHAILGLQAGGAHTITGETEAPLARLILLHVSSPPSEAQQLLVLAGDEVDSSVLEQGREHKQQTDGHPDIDGFNVRHLGQRGS